MRSITHNDEIARWKSVVNEKNGLKLAGAQQESYIRSLEHARAVSPESLKLLTPYVSSFTKELPMPAFASQGLPTTEAYITAHGVIDDPVLEVTCDNDCFYESALAVNTSTFADPKQISPTKIRVHFVIPASLMDRQQVSIRVRSKRPEAIHSLKVRRVGK